MVDSFPHRFLGAMRRRAPQDPNAVDPTRCWGIGGILIINDEAHHVYGEKRTPKGEEPRSMQVEQNP